MAGSINSHSSVHVDLAQIAADIQSQVGLLGKMHKVRVRAWIKKLYEATSNRIWKKNRNQYAALLLEQIRNGVMMEPFNTLPREEPGLPPFQQHFRCDPPRHVACTIPTFNLCMLP